jgi:hypothetical protein
MALVALGGATFALFGGTFGPWTTGCNYATNGDYQTMYTTAGQTAIQNIAAGIPSLGTDWDALVVAPATTFAQTVWANWVDTRVPDDLPNNTIVAR